MKVLFHEETHTYTMDGRPAPGIHDILGASGVTAGIPHRPDILNRGKRGHKAVELDLRNDLYIPDLTPDEIGWVNSARAAREALGLAKLRPEVLVYNRRLWYATRVDATGLWEGVPVVINWKTGGPMPFYPIQAAAEQACFKGAKPRHLTIYLSSDGSFDPKRDAVELTNPKYSRIWKACCEVAGFMYFEGGASLPPGPGKESSETFTAPIQDSKLFNPIRWPEEPGGIFG